MCFDGMLVYWMICWHFGRFGYIFWAVGVLAVLKDQVGVLPGALKLVSRNRYLVDIDLGNATSRDTCGVKLELSLSRYH